jgi:transcriptional regulator with XRE-family HTH domain
MVQSMKVLHDYLRISGLSQVELAKKAGINPMAINHFLRGRRQPGIANLRKLSAATGIGIEKLCEGMK